MDPHVVLNYWFPNNRYQSFWFDGSVDGVIKEKYSETLVLAEQGNLDDWLDTNDGKLALIILFDQFTRNLYRHTELRKKNDSKALELSMSLLDKLHEFPIHQAIFVLMPLRHQNQSTFLNIVLAKLKIYEAHDEVHKDNMLESEKIYARFKLATLRNYTNLTDEIQVFDTLCDCVGDHSGEIPIEHINSSPSSHLNGVFDNEILDDQCRNYKCITIGNLSGIIPCISLMQPVRKYLAGKRVGVSVSGGVDSMALAHLTVFAQICPFVCAIHLDYGNRDDSAAEAEFIKTWCIHVLCIPFITRRINHMKRATTDRRFYEQETKEIRFALYKYCIDAYTLDCVCLGHHLDDVNENILTNVCKANDILDLDGMTDVSIQNHVTIVRPFLKYNKSHIYDFAHAHTVPYMKDTTPVESQRGVIRTQLMPIIIKYFGINMYKIGEQSTQIRELLDIEVFGKKYRELRFEKLGTVMTIDTVNTNMKYWSTMLVHIFHKMGYNMISNKNLEMFIVWINNKHNGIIRFSNDCIGVIDRGEKIVLYIYKHVI